MKKTAMFALAFVFLLGTTGVIAKNNGDGKNFHKPLQVNKEKVKHFAKKPISNSDRKRGDLLEEMIIKEKPANVKPAPTDPTSGGVTGNLGDQMEPGEGKKYAIVIGLANYPGTSIVESDEILPDLCVSPIAENDASVYEGTNEVKANCKDGDSVNMEKTLIEKYGFAPSNVFRLSDSEATFSAIEEKIMYLVGGIDSKEFNHTGILKPEDELVFFFSGHGALSEDDSIDGDIDENDDGGIVVYDEEYSDDSYMSTDPASTYAADYNKNGYSDSAYIWDGQLRAWFANAATDRIFFAFDTCRAEEMDDLVWTDIYRTTKEPDRVLAFSSGKEESSYTYYLGGANNSGNIHDSEGLFSHYFVLRAMYDGYADGFNPINKRSKDPLKYDGKVAVEEAFSYAYPLVREASSNNQTPHLDDLFTNDLLLGTPPELVKTVYVYANNSEETAPYTLKSGVKYLLEASKVAAADETNTIRFDAKYSTNTTTGLWTDLVDQSYADATIYPTLLELFMNDASVDWGEYNDEHKYRKEVTGSDSLLPSVNFKINDTDYSDNSEELLVKIYQLD
ncbi:MAG: caspase family protein [Candidatus Moranbacteria bacterium]|nr:caspase family protein [Candidatus Moranbacteria bacterium]